jgi:hypothetical protein
VNNVFLLCVRSSVLRAWRAALINGDAYSIYPPTSRRFGNENRRSGEAIFPISQGGGKAEHHTPIAALAASLHASEMLAHGIGAGLRPS